MSDLSNYPFRFTCEGVYSGFRAANKQGETIGYASVLLGGIATVSFKCEEKLFLEAKIGQGDPVIVEGYNTQRSFQQTMVTESIPVRVTRNTTLERAARSATESKRTA